MPPSLPELPGGLDDNGKDASLDMGVVYAKFASASERRKGLVERFTGALEIRIKCAASAIFGLAALPKCVQLTDSPLRCLFGQMTTFNPCRTTPPSTKYTWSPPLRTLKSASHTSTASSAPKRPGGFRSA